MLTPKGIWSYSQNKPSLVADDLEGYVEREVVLKSLLKRGVFKWLAVRRDLIRLKNEWRDQLTDLYIKAQDKSAPDYERTVGRIKALEECRGEVRALCHSERWRAPDNCSESQDFLRQFPPDGGD